MILYIVLSLEHTTQRTVSNLQDTYMSFSPWLVKEIGSDIEMLFFIKKIWNWDIFSRKFTIALFVFDLHIWSQFKNVLLGKSDNTSAGVRKEKSEGGKFTKEFEDEEVYGPRNLNTWADIKEYNNGEERKWFEEENAYLGKYDVEVNTHLPWLSVPCFPGDD